MGTHLCCILFHLFWLVSLCMYVHTVALMYYVIMYALCCLSFPVPEILCGDPPILPHTGHVWSGSSTPGSTVAYYCKIGFYHSEGHNVSVCTINGFWTKPNISCRGNNLLQHIVSAVVELTLSSLSP